MFCISRPLLRFQSQNDLDKVYKYMPPSFIRTTYAPVPVPVDDADDTDDTSGVRLVFDTGSLAYTCLKGCMYMLHKSMLHYPVIIKNTLVDGYGIQLRIKTYSKDDDWLDVPSEIFKLAVRIKDAVKITEAVLANDVVKAARAHPFLNADTFAALKTRQADRQQLDKLEMQQLWEYSMAVMKYRVRPDAEFIDAYVGAYISSHRCVCLMHPVPFRDIYSQQCFSQGKNSNTLKRLQSRVIRDLQDSKDELIVFLCKIMISPAPFSHFLSHFSHTPMRS